MLSVDVIVGCHDVVVYGGESRKKAIMLCCRLIVVILYAGWKASVDIK
jgi:hypothetical protein